MDTCNSFFLINACRWGTWTSQEWESRSHHHPSKLVEVLTKRAGNLKCEIKEEDHRWQCDLETSWTKGLLPAVFLLISFTQEKRLLSWRSFSRTYRNTWIQEAQRLSWVLHRTVEIPCQVWRTYFPWLRTAASPNFMLLYWGSLYPITCQHRGIRSDPLASVGQLWSSIPVSELSVDLGWSNLFPCLLLCPVLSSHSFWSPKHSWRSFMPTYLHLGVCFLGGKHGEGQFTKTEEEFRNTKVLVLPAIGPSYQLYEGTSKRTWNKR